MKGMKKYVLPLILLFLFTACGGGGGGGGSNSGVGVKAAPVTIDPKTIPKYGNVISDQTGSNLGVYGATSLATSSYTVTMNEAQAQILPAGFVLPGGGGYIGTWTWQYSIAGTVYPGGVRDTYLGPVVVAQRDTPVTVTYVNNLTSVAANTNLLFYRTSVDQTLHWADPLGLMCMDALGNCGLPYAGPIPTVVHLHGGEVPSQYDGGPDAWFTSGLDGNPVITGPGYSTNVYTYNNIQEAAPIWYHDHALGATRLNVYAGLAGGYVLTDGATSPTTPANLPGPVPLVIQDRMFNLQGELYFPNIGINPAVHPFWMPEFFGNVIVVNGKSWPTMQVDAKRYRFIVLNGSNARFYELSIEKGPSFWVIGTDGGYLDAPKQIASPNKLLIAPGERYEVIVDFTGLAGKTFTVTNTAKAPYPKGAAPDPQTTGQVMQFFVRTPAPAPGTDTSCNPAAGGCTRLTPIKRLVNPATGIINATIQKVRKLTLNEVMGMAGPLEVLVNNSKWDGLKSPGINLDVASFPDGVTELPQVGTTEVWEIINLTADAHPIHLHLTQFQLISRQPFNVSGYNKVYAALFPGLTAPPYPVAGAPGPYLPGVFIPGYGPPKPYGFYTNLANIPVGATPWLGGNPDYTPFLQDVPRMPLPHEAGWKDTVIMYPGEVTRIAVRWAPQSIPLGGETVGVSQYGFDPTTGPGYVWHCHIIDHEDNEMMRPLKVKFSSQ